MDCVTTAGVQSGSAANTHIGVTAVCTYQMDGEMVLAVTAGGDLITVAVLLNYGSAQQHQSLVQNVGTQFRA